MVSVFAPRSIFPAPTAVVLPNCICPEPALVKVVFAPSVTALLMTKICVLPASVAILGSCAAPTSCTRFSVPPVSVSVALLFCIAMLFSEIVPRSFVAVTAVATPVVKLKLKSVV